MLSTLPVDSDHEPAKQTRFTATEFSALENKLSSLSEQLTALTQIVEDGLADKTYLAEASNDKLDTQLPLLRSQSKHGMQRSVQAVLAEQAQIQEKKVEESRLSLEQEVRDFNREQRQQVKELRDEMAKFMEEKANKELTTNDGQENVKVVMNRQSPEQLASILLCVNAIKQSQEQQEKLLTNFVQQNMTILTSNASATPPEWGANLDDVAVLPSPEATSALPNCEARKEEEEQQDTLWNEFQDDIEKFDPHCQYKKVLKHKVDQRSFWHDLFDHLGWSAILSQQMPDSWQARLTAHWTFQCLQSLLIIMNAAFMGYETDHEVKAALAQPAGESPKWLRTCSLVFNIIFAAELIFRIIALRTWFWVAPREWGWNFFDVVVVAISALFNLFTGVNLSFIRTLRIIRVFRAARLIRVLRFFRKLREMLYSILACLQSLTWSLLFLAATIFMFSLVCVQGAAQIDYADESDEFRAQVQEWFGSLGTSMFTLLAVVTGGIEWWDLEATLRKAGSSYTAAFIVYLLFVQIGVMNVLTAVFLQSASEFMDIDIIVQKEEMRVEVFCDQVMKLFLQLTGEEMISELDWKTFQKSLESDAMQGYMSSLGLEPTHIRLVFDLLDTDHSGKIDLDEFVMGLVKLKGEAKAIDARIIQRELGMMPNLLKQVLEELHGDETHTHGIPNARAKDFRKRKT